MPELEKQFQKRQVAYKVRISSILNENFVKDDLSAGYIKINGINVTRVNVIANLVYKSEETGYSSAIADDGSGRIQLRSFESSALFAKVDVGDVVLVIGKIREFNKEKYISPEIIKKMNSIEWLNLRMLELKEVSKKADTNINGGNALQEIDINKDVYELIKKLDTGEGVAIADLVNNSKATDVERIVSKLLENGDIFEIKPGKIKVLE